MCFRGYIFSLNLCSTIDQTPCDDYEQCDLKLGELLAKAFDEIMEVVATIFPHLYTCKTISFSIVISVPQILGAN